MSMGFHHPYPLDLCAYDEDPSQLIIRPGWEAPHVRCSPRTFCAWPCLLRQVGTVLGSPYDCVVARLAYANPRSRQRLGFDRSVMKKHWSTWLASTHGSFFTVTFAPANLDLASGITMVVKYRSSFTTLLAHLTRNIDTFSPQ